eukprot:IDg16213t1
MELPACELCTRFIQNERRLRRLLYNCSQRHIQAADSEKTFTLRRKLKISYHRNSNACSPKTVFFRMCSRASSAQELDYVEHLKAQMCTCSRGPCSFLHAMMYAGVATARN